MARSTAASVPDASKATSTVERVGDILRGGHELRPGALGRGAAVRERIDGERDPRARGARDFGDQQPDRAAADHGHVRAEPHVAEVEGVDGDAQRLEQRAGDAVHRVRERVERRGRPRQVLAQPAVGVPMTGEDDLWAQVAVALEAARAGPARAPPGRPRRGARRAGRPRRRPRTRGRGRPARSARRRRCRPPRTSAGRSRRVRPPRRARGSPPPPARARARRRRAHRPARAAVPPRLGS